MGCANLATSNDQTDEYVKGCFMRKTVINDKNIYVMYATMRMRSKRREKENKKNAQRSTKKREGDPRYIAPSLRCHSALGVQTNPRVKRG